MLFPALAFGQGMRSVVYEFNPIVGPVSIDSVTMTGSSDTLKFFRGMETSAAGEFTAAMVGKRIICVDSADRLQWNTTVASYIGDSAIVLSDTVSMAGTEDSLATVQIEGVFTSAIYASGDAIGFPHEVNIFEVGRVRQYYRLQKIIVIDTSDQGTNLDLIFFDDPPVPSPDNAALVLDESQGPSLFYVVTVDSWDDFGASDIGIETPNVYFPITQYPQMYVQLVAAGTPTYTSQTCLFIKMIFLVE
jgi:hypothetical protein